MIDVKQNALEMLEDGMSVTMVAAYSGTPEAQIREWRDGRDSEPARSPILALMHRGMTCEEIAKEIGCSPETAHHLVVSAWRNDKERR